MKRKLEAEEEPGPGEGKVIRKSKKKQQREDEVEVVGEPVEIEVEVEEEAPKIKIDFNTATLATLLENYTATLSSDDLEIFGILSRQKKKELEVLPLFGPKRVEKASKLSNPLLAHTGRANTILSFLDDKKAFNTSLQYDDDMTQTPNPGGFYDFRFLLPVLGHTLDEKNICDALKIIQNGWIYLIMRGMCLRDEALRNISFLCLKRLIFNLHQPKLAKNHDVKIWLHFLHAIRRGISQLGETRISHLISTWLVASWEVVRQPSHPMFNRLTSFLLAKPTLEMTILPEFIPFYNASDGNKESREWVLNVLYWGLKTNEDWRLAQKLPIVKFLCSSFTLEKLKTKKNIVGILTRGAGISEVAQVMVEKYAIPLWISNIVTRDNYLQTHIGKLYQSLRSNCSDRPNSNRNESLFEYVRQKIQINVELAQASKLEETEEVEDEDKVKTEEGTAVVVVVPEVNMEV